MTTKRRETKKSSFTFKRINEIFVAGYADALQDITAYITVQCGQCRMNFLFNCARTPKIDYGIISDAHGIVRGYRFRFHCPNCGTLLRVDEDELEFRVWATPNSQHS